MGAYAGQTAVLWLQAHNEGGGNPASFLLDDVTLGIIPRLGVD